MLSPKGQYFLDAAWPGFKDFPALFRTFVTPTSMWRANSMRWSMNSCRSTMRLQSLKPNYDVWWIKVSRISYLLAWRCSWNSKSNTCLAYSWCGFHLDSQHQRLVWSWVKASKYDLGQHLPIMILGITFQAYISTVESTVSEKHLTWNAIDLIIINILHGWKNKKQAQKMCTLCLLVTLTSNNNFDCRLSVFIPDLHY